MTVKGDRKWMRLDYEASSLYSVIADGQYRNTSAGQAAWKSLIAGSSLQPNCNQEGFNFGKGGLSGRLGLGANNEDDCDSCDSWIGFGVRITYCNVEAACGNYQPCFGDPDVLNYPAFGYILVQ